MRDAHLPQGAPTSPALANLAAFRLDQRLEALARRFGAAMTRYADDLAFSGDHAFDHALPVFLPLAGAIALEEGFHINYRKTRVMRRSEAQWLCGLVVFFIVAPPPRPALRTPTRRKEVQTPAS